MSETLSRTGSRTNSPERQQAHRMCYSLCGGNRFWGAVALRWPHRDADNGSAGKWRPALHAVLHHSAVLPLTSASLLTGRNHTTVGTACICEAATGFPGSNGHIPFETATIAEVLSEEGYNTYMLGKWHCCPEDETNMASTKRNWPTGRGFEQFYGFLGGETNQ
jgi:hypothetical protein